MIARDALAAYCIACGASAATWVLVAEAAHQREAWDSAVYFQLGLPALALVIFVVGFIWPARAWRWGVAAGVAHTATSLLYQPKLGPLAAVGFALLAVLTGCLVIVAVLGGGIARLRRP